LGISQSGKSPDIVEVIAEGRRQGRPTIALTNAPDSSLAQVAEHHLYLHAGDEHAVAATKTYTTSLAALALLSSALSDDPSRISEIMCIPDLMQQTLEFMAPLLGRVERYRYMVHSIVIGRGYNYSTAFEIALKIKELTRVVTEPYSSADFRHGPIAMVREGFPVIVVAPSGAVHEDIRYLVEELVERGGELLVISDSQGILDYAKIAFPLPQEVPEWLSPLVAVIPGQLFGMALAQAKGLDPDQPSGITKVTETK
jgi:glucosamine--fructose-6-phosphate aminotransferase (isomerizing)